MSDNAKSDFLYGVEAIAAYLGITERQARFRALKGEVPTFKMGRSVCARRSSLDASIAEREAAARKAAA